MKSFCAIRESVKDAVKIDKDIKTYLIKNKIKYKEITLDNAIKEILKDIGE